ncbi:MAG: acetylglutamate kinase, partial [Trichococcus flocculiformis]
MKMNKSNCEKAEMLVEVLPYVNRFRDKIIVIKYGGNAMINEDLKKAVMQDLLLMKSVGMHP